MSKKVLIVETSLAVRGIAESLLRQNGYEVVAADTVDGAREILQGSKIDLLLVASDINDNQGKPYYELLATDSEVAGLPFLILHDPSAGELSYPPEAIINKPFTPRDFLEAVAVFGGREDQPAMAESSPFSGADFEEDLIDSALGLDKIEVDGSEVMEDDTGVYRKERKHKTESMIGFDYTVKTGDTAKTTIPHIDAVNVPPEPEPLAADIPSPEVSPAETPAPDAPPAKTPAPKTPPADTETKAEEIKAEPEFLGDKDDIEPPRPDVLSESSKIEIITDQYGIIASPESFEAVSPGDSQETHDYEWFLTELQKEADSADQPAAPPAPPAKEVPSAPRAKDAPPAPGQPAVSDHSEAVDKFISEFKKEMEKITSDGAASIPVANIPPPEAGPEAPVKAGPALPWEDKLENITPGEIRNLSKEMVQVMASRVAEQIVARLDTETVYRLIKEVIDDTVRRRVHEKSKQS